MLCSTHDDGVRRTMAAPHYRRRSMTRIPNFARVEFAEEPVATAPGAAEPWITPEGISVKPIYGPSDLAELDFLETYPGIPPHLRGPYPTMYVPHPSPLPQYAPLP